MVPCNPVQLLDKGPGSWVILAQLFMSFPARGKLRFANPVASGAIPMSFNQLTTTEGKKII